MPRVLMYHGLETADQPSEMTDPGDLVYVLGLDAFHQQLDWLARDGWRIVSPAKAVMASRDVVLTFDDGHVSNYELALPSLRERRLPACFFITTDWIDTGHYMTSAMVRELAGAGMSIGAHGASHRFLTDLSDDEARAELAGSRERLEDITGARVTTFSAPGGRVDERIARLARDAGYTAVYTSDVRPRFALSGITAHGRLALKRNYSAGQFADMVRRNRAPESPLLGMGLRMAKRVLGNARYQAMRSAALKLRERVR